jgi:hypothetical protein
VVDPRQELTQINGPFSERGNGECYAETNEKGRLNEVMNRQPGFETALQHAQFSAVDVFRHMQGELLASLGFRPVESPYRIIASAPYWRLRDYNTTHRSPAVLIVAAPIKRPYIWDRTTTVLIGGAIEAAASARERK